MAGLLAIDLLQKISTAITIKIYVANKDETKGDPTSYSEKV